MSPLSRRRLLKVLGSGAGLFVGGARARAASPPEPGADAPDGGPDAGPAAATALLSNEQAPDPSDPIAILYGRRLAFASGAPQVTVRILDGVDTFTFLPTGGLQITGRANAFKPVASGKSGRWTVRLAQANAGRSVIRVQVGEHLFEDSLGAEAEAQLFRTHGYKVSLVNVGSVYGIAGHTVDTRHVLVLIDGDGTQATAEKLAAELSERFSLRPDIYREPIERGHGIIEVVDPDGDVVARGPDALSFEVAGRVTVEKVEHSMGYPDHGFEDRDYVNRFFAAVDARGKLAAVNMIPLETLTKGIVPSEIFPSAHVEALKAQAVTARGEILGKVGARHVGDPYLLCAEQHCQVFRGTTGEKPRSTLAVDATRGEALFAPKGGPLVPSYYSAICGGHTEDNDKVWGGPPNPSIRGRPDFPVGVGSELFAEGIGEALLRRWLDSDVPAYCRTASTARPEKYRWKKSFSQAEVDAIVAPFNIGTAQALDVDGRGISGRARTLVLKGTTGEARVHTELAIRRLFRMLPSGMFVIDTAGTGAQRIFHFHGGGWGHGAGMCQTGAIGRAEKGASYRDILRVYFSGAEVVRIYA